jgi:uncharacterized membrane protein YhaH (DUF805 family)
MLSSYEDLVDIFLQVFLPELCMHFSRLHFTSIEQIILLYLMIMILFGGEYKL